jgi:PHD/YefM family antitoxin component YafN of YafNO toxin-antitoxin module
MSESYSLAHGPAELEEIVVRASHQHEQVNLTDEDGTVAVIVPLAEFQELQRAADEADLAEAETVKAQGGPWIPHADVVAMLERDDAADA